jgi:hypothetical protein
MPFVSVLTTAQGGFLTLAEFFTLRRAAESVRRYPPLQHGRLRSYVAGADARIVAGRRASTALTAAVLLREGLVLLLRSAEVARGRDDAGPLSAERLSELLGTVPADPASARTASADDARVREALLAVDPLYLDRLDPDDIEATRWALDRACVAARKKVEPRSLVHLRGLRWGRMAGVLLIAGYAAFAWLRPRLGPVDVALGKPVHASSRHAGGPDGRDLVDGDVGTSYAVLTNTEDDPNVVIDLQGLFTLDRVVVYNRVDGWFDDSLPLVVECSTDGTRYDEVARREQHFDADPPWVVPARGRIARYVRLRVARRSYLALSEVEVFGRPQR